MTPPELKQRFEHLLHGLTPFLAGADEKVGPHTTQLRRTLENFIELRKRADASERIVAGEDQKIFSALLAGYNEALDRYRKNQEDLADEFNLLGVMNLTGKEVRHSMVLAWLLDHDLRRLGTHAQGNLGFKLFLAEFALPPDYMDCKYRVSREVEGEESIVDIEVICRDRFLIHIENKIWAAEGNAQTDREWSDILRKAGQLHISSTNVHAFFLTPHGATALNPNFRAIRWGQVARVLERFAEQAKPADVKLFAAHYARVLRRFIVFQDPSGGGHGETTSE
jgi:hypothetical protein